MKFFGLIVLSMLSILYGSKSNADSFSSCQKLLTTLSQRATENSPEYLMAAATIDRACVSEIIDKSGSQSYSFALAAGFPSVLYRKLEQGDFLSILTAAAKAGDRYLFVRDDQLLPILKEIISKTTDENVDLAALYDFVAAAQNKGAAAAINQDRYLRYAPMTNISRAAIKEHCDRAVCGSFADADRIECDKNDSLSKWDFIDGDGKINWKDINRCKSNAAFIVNLRRVGILDGYCSGTMQENSVLGVDSIGPSIECSGLFVNFPRRAFGTTDIILYLRLLKDTTWRQKVPPSQLDRNKKIIVDAIPGLKQYLD